LELRKLGKTICNELPEEQTHKFRAYMAASADRNTISPELIALQTGKAIERG
jgi:hypothetical protein